MKYKQEYNAYRNDCKKFELPNQIKIVQSKLKKNIFLSSDKELITY